MVELWGKGKAETQLALPQTQSSWILYFTYYELPLYIQS